MYPYGWPDVTKEEAEAIVAIVKTFMARRTTPVETWVVSDFARRHWPDSISLSPADQIKATARALQECGAVEMWVKRES